MGHAGWVLATAAALGVTAPALAQTVQLRPGMAAGEIAQARVVRLPVGVRDQDLSLLRDDQVVETPSGRRVQVGRLRQVQALIRQAQMHTAQPRRGGFPILPPASGPGTPRRPGESAAQLLARPPTDVIRLRNGHTVSVAQLRAMAPYVERQYHVNLAGPAAGRPRLDGPAILITSAAQLKSVPRDAPDSTVLTSPHGVRITVGELRAAFKARPRPPSLLQGPAGGAAR